MTVTYGEALPDSDDDLEDDDDVFVSGCSIINERSPSGRVLLASCDVRAYGITIFGCCLMINREGRICISAPRATGRRKRVAPERTIQFKSKGLRDEITELALDAYRAKASEDWTQPQFQRGGE